MTKKSPTGKNAGNPNTLREIRTKAGLSRAELATAAELAELTVRRIEQGHPSKASTRYKILNALNRINHTSRLYQEVFPKDPEVDE